MRPTPRSAAPLARCAGRRRGIAALSVVMVLFFVMAMVAAYTNRNLLFEQRIATNSYRASRALEAADAGVEWTVALLNGGRIDGNCQPSTDAGDTDFRRRYLVDALPNANGEGGYDVVWGNVSANRVYPACVNRDGMLSCICPTMGAATPAFGGVADGLGSAFRVELLRPGNDILPGAIEFAARGCASVGEGDSACTSQRQTILPTVDGLSGALTTVGLVRALPVAPPAALTAGTTLDSSAGQLRVANGDDSTGVALHAGTIVRNPGADLLAGPAGGTGTVEWADAALPTLSGAANDGWFRAMFGMDPGHYQRQPGVVRIPCTAGCNTASLNTPLAGHPRNPIWVDGNLDLDTVANLGSAADPLMLIVTGQLTVSSDVQLTGFVHANSIVWGGGGAGASVQGAMVAKTTFTAASLVTVTYDRAVLDTIRLRYGSFVRAPGSWNLIFR